MFAPKQNVRRFLPNDLYCIARFTRELISTFFFLLGRDSQSPDSGTKKLFCITTTFVVSFFLNIFIATLLLLP